MNTLINPKYILRNYEMEEAIKLAETQNDFTLVSNLLNRSLNPFDTQKLEIVSRPSDRFSLCVSCSSWIKNLL